MRVIFLTQFDKQIDQVNIKGLVFLHLIIVSLKNEIVFLVSLIFWDLLNFKFRTRNSRKKLQNSVPNRLI